MENEKVRSQVYPYRSSSQSRTKGRSYHSRSCASPQSQEEEIMPISLRRMNSAIKYRLLSKEKQAEVNQFLFEEIQDGDVVEQFLKSPAWQKIICPWLEQEAAEALGRLDGYAHQIPQDNVGFGERGRRNLIEDFRSMLNEKLKKREVARQRMQELQLTGDKR